MAENGKVTTPPDQLQLVDLTAVTCEGCGGIESEEREVCWFVRAGGWYCLDCYLERVRPS